jgi:hypothetical protein
MRQLLRETVREARWLAGGAHAVLLLACVVAAVWYVVSSLSFAVVAAEQLASTMTMVEASGQSVPDALAAPADVSTGADGQELIGNPLRYDYEAARRALAQLTGAGALAGSLSLAALIFFPAAGYVLGVHLATHDLRSGAVITRWPQAGAAAFVGAKLLAALGVAAILPCAVALLAWALSGAVAPWRPSLGARDAHPPLPGADVVVGLLALASLILAVFAMVGLAVGSTTRERTVSVTAFALAFFLVPLLGEWDPRNLLTMAGRGLLFFGGSFQPALLGEAEPAAGIAGLAVLGVAGAACVAPAWLLRRRTL